jgi:hypothetical protein
MPVIFRIRVFALRYWPQSLVFFYLNWYPDRDYPIRRVCIYSPSIYTYVLSISLKHFQIDLSPKDCQRWSRLMETLSNLQNWIFAGNHLLPIFPIKTWKLFLNPSLSMASPSTSICPDPVYYKQERLRLQGYQFYMSTKMTEAQTDQIPMIQARDST